MPEISLSDFSLEGKSAAELEQRRREIVTTLQRFPGYDDPDIPLPLLQELALVTGMLRRKNSGPPKVAREKRVPKVATLDDLLDLVKT